MIQKVAQKILDTEYLKYRTAVSKKVLNEFNAEHFKLKTLKTLYYDKRYKSDIPNKKVYVQSIHTHEPVEVEYSLNKTKIFCDTEYNYKFFLHDHPEKELSSKTYSIRKKYKCIESIKDIFKIFKTEMIFGYQCTVSNDFLGLGIRGDELQIRDALNRGIKIIKKNAMPEATLFHVRMGFKPIPDLYRVKSKKDVFLYLNELIKNSPSIEQKNYTPIIVAKISRFGERYYFDRNSTQALANLRQVKQLVKNEPRKARDLSLNSYSCTLALFGKELDIWKKMIAGLPVNKT